MKNLKLPILLLCISLVFWGCKNDSSSSSSSGGSSKGSKSELRPAQGGKHYGGVFNMNETEYLRSLYPLNIGEVVGHRISNQIYEGLVRLNQADLTVKPCLAERWEANENATQYTFYLRKGVKFHDDACFSDGKGREMTAKDFKYCLDKLCISDPQNKGYGFVKDRILGARAYSDAVAAGNKPAGGVEGIKVIDDYTIQINLSQPFSSFLHILAMPFGYVFPPEADAKYGSDMRAKAIGTGPFYLKTLKENEACILLRNPNYWQKDASGNQLPYLDAVRFTFIADQKAELMEFKKGNLDMIYRLPLEMADEIKDRKGNLKEGYTQYQFQEKPAMSVEYYGFKTLGDIFKDKRLRQAFSYAVDREKLVEFTLKGAGIPGHYGSVPPAFPQYDHKQIKGYKFDPAKAKALMKEAGYPNGEGFPEITLQINSGGTRNEQVAEAVQKMLTDNLNIKMNITKMPFAQHLESVESSKADFWRAGWIADYPDPENFLTLFWSDHIPPKMTDRSYQNTTRFTNAEYDRLFTDALATVDDKARFQKYLEADKIVTEHVPWLVLFYQKDQRLLQPYVRNYPQNPMEYRNLVDVYFKPDEYYQKYKVK